MMALFLAWVIGSCLVIGYVCGRIHEMDRNRRRRQRKTQRIPLLLRSAAPISDKSIQLPKIPRRYQR